MSVPEDLISFDIIETQKENIQSLPGGRSAKALASRFAPVARSSYASVTPSDTRNLNDAIREEYEAELASIQESDDPLDIYDRYVKWTLSAYPSAQATPESRLRALLEQATKAFQSTQHYKNDARYLKLWLHYIRFFADAPRETFAYLARHRIGESLALYYEEFAAWLEKADRWLQAEEVYRLGMERQARPVERLARKAAEFRARFEARPLDEQQPTSPALPTIRPALAAKIDPFAGPIAPPASDSQQRAQSVRNAERSTSSTGRQTRQKLAIFSDKDDGSPAILPSQDAVDKMKGWDTIGELAHRKKENTAEPKPWQGEVLKTTKRLPSGPKMTVYKDETPSSCTNAAEIVATGAQNERKSTNAQEILNPKTGRIDRVFARLDIIYPGSDSNSDEYSFEELRAKARGYLDRDWSSTAVEIQEQPVSGVQRINENQQSADSTMIAQNDMGQDAEQRDEPHLDCLPANACPVETTIAINIDQDGCCKRVKKKNKEVKSETQTVKTNLDSPSGPRLRRKNSSEPTMTLHTRAATDDILDIFNQPLRNTDAMAGPDESEVETEPDDNDDYTSGGESTGTGKFSVVSDLPESEANSLHEEAFIATVEDVAEQIDGWQSEQAMDNAKGRGEGEHVAEEEIEVNNEQSEPYSGGHPSDLQRDDLNTEVTLDQRQENIVSQFPDRFPRSKYAPVRPDDYQSPVRYSRDPDLPAQNRLPFMTPIIEKTETSLGTFSAYREKDLLSAKTPCRGGSQSRVLPEIDEGPMSSPFQEIVNESQPVRPPKLRMKTTKKPAESNESALKKGPIIQDRQCNPVSEDIRGLILERLMDSIRLHEGFHDFRPRRFGRGAEIRKFIKHISKAKSSEKSTTSFVMPPELIFDDSGEVYTIRRELGKGAFAPVYLAEKSKTIDGVTAPKEEGDDKEGELVAIKCEDPPTMWEFHIMNVLRGRLSHDIRSCQSLLQARALHLFQDECYLVEDFLDRGTLLDLVNVARAEPGAGQPGVDESVAMFFTIEVLRVVEAMHTVGILHGDLKADNCLVRLPSNRRPGQGMNNAGQDGESEIWELTYHADGSHGWRHRGISLIDFGRSIDLRNFASGTQFIADWKTTKQDCVEMRELRPWTYQIDYFGIAGIVHSLLFGKYIEDMVVGDTRHRAPSNENTDLPDLGELHIHRPLAKNEKHKRYRLREPFKRYWQTELWQSLFDMLLNPTNPTCHMTDEEDGNLPITASLTLIRQRMESWLETDGCKRNGGLQTALRKLEEKLADRRR